MKFIVPALCILLLAAPALEAQSTDPVLDPRIESLVAEVDADRLLAIVEHLESFGTRHTMSTTDHSEWGIGAAREWMLEEMGSYSDRLQVSFDAYDVEPQGRIQVRTDLRNVKAILPGRSDRRIYVSGHYDSVVYGDYDSTAVPQPPTDGQWDGYAPGANDDASGTAIAMELARVFAQSGLEFDATLVFIGFAGEEQGLVGARLHAERMVDEEVEITAVFNNDMIGNSMGGTGIQDARTVRIFAPGPEDSPARQLARYIHRVGSLYMPGHEIRLIAREDRFGRGGDHTPFNQNGFAAVRFTESRENFERQHTILDTSDGVDPEYLQKNARVNVAGVASLALAPAAPRATPQMLRRGDGYDAQLNWEASEGAVGYRVVWRNTWNPDWEHSLYVGDVTQFTLEDMSIDDFVYGVAAVGPDGHESLVTPYVR
jgi:hypothetical protein